jgi:hypothetical protein
MTEYLQPKTELITLDGFLSQVKQLELATFVPDSEAYNDAVDNVFESVCIVLGRDVSYEFIGATICEAETSLQLMSQRIVTNTGATTGAVLL